MCLEKQPTKVKIDRLIEAVENLTHAIMLSNSYHIDTTLPPESETPAL